MTDEEYLAQAGIDAETGNPAKAEAATASPTPESSPEGQQQTPPDAKTVAEMFEIGGHKFPVNTEFKLTHGGKILNVPYSSMANTYRQWQHLQDKWANEYKPKIEEFEKTKPEFEKYKGFYDKYGALQEWSEQHPDQWQRLQEVWQNKDKHLLEAQVGQPGSENQFKPFVDKISQLEERLNKADEYIKKYEDSVRSREEEANVNAVKAEIQDFQKEFPEINLDERDPDGVALWAKIVQWGTQNKYNDFAPAAMMYLKQRIADTYASRARKEAVGAVKQDRMNGVIKRSATPFNQGQEPVVKPASDLRRRSYGDLAEEAKAELAAMGS